MSETEMDDAARNRQAGALLVDAQVAWMLPGQRLSAPEALARLRTICRAHPDLFTAVWTIAATHPDVPNQMLAQAVRNSHTEAAGLSDADVVSLLVAVRTSGKEAFDAVMRTRRRAARASAAPVSWMGSSDP